MKFKGLLSAAVAVALTVLPAFGHAPRVQNRVTTTNAVSVVVTTNAATRATRTSVSPAVERSGWYYDTGHVVAYLRAYGKLPGNYLTKNEARALGWQGGPVEPYAPGKAIGGDRFGNYEGRLPRGSWRECDIDTKGRPRGAKRVIYSEDKRTFYYTEDHYQTFRKVQ